MPDSPPETIPWRVKTLEQQHEHLTQRHEKKAAELELEIDKLRERFDARERNMFIAGITFLVGIIASLVSILWANLGAIFPGK